MESGIVSGERKRFSVDSILTRRKMILVGYKRGVRVLLVAIVANIRISSPTDDSSVVAR